MSWQAPWLWAGAIAIALPILIHLLGQGRARRIPFPSLRFFADTRPLPTARTRLHDLVLLVVRCLILIAAAAALARPILHTAHRNATYSQLLARAIVLDTSASMLRQTAGGIRAIDEGTRQAQRLADSATIGVLLRAASPRSTIAGAVAWLRRQGTRGEVAIVSDFQAGALDSIDLAAIPGDLGVRLVRIAVDTATGPIDATIRYRDADVTASMTRSRDGIDVDWRTGPAAAPFDIEVLAAPGDSTAVDAARAAATTIGVPLPVDTTRHIVMIFPGYPSRQQLIDKSVLPRHPWMGDAAARVEATLDTARMIVAADTSRGNDRLLLFVQVEPGSTLAATAIGAARRALSIATPMSESERATISDSTLAAWQRMPVARTEPGPQADQSDGRWFWLVALVLLALESVIRRSGRARAEVADVAAG